jgi:hypothetical protein
MGWLWASLGLDDPGGPWYLFWSGLGSDLPIFAAIGLFYWHHTCKVGRCWRWGHRKTVKGDVVCFKHHPRGVLTHQQVLDDHAKANA